MSNATSRKSTRQHVAAQVDIEFVSLDVHVRAVYGRATRPVLSAVINSRTYLILGMALEWPSDVIDIREQFPQLRLSSSGKQDE